MIIVRFGNGAGKTRIAITTILRALGTNKNVFLGYFYKPYTLENNEIRMIGCNPNLIVKHFGENSLKYLKDDKENIINGWNQCKEVLENNNSFLYVFDEIFYAFEYEHLTINEVIEAIKPFKKIENKYIFLTGRNCPQQIIDISDDVSEVKCIKHPYYDGIQAKKGIDF